MPQSKERKAEYQRDFRARQKEGTSLDNKGGTSEPWYPNKRTNDEGSPITPVTLSDGQQWYPNPLSVFRHYAEEKHGKVLHLDNGSYIHVDKLIPPRRVLLEYLVEPAKIGEDNLRVGVNGPTIKECKKLLDVTE
ncbi:hypothetical protein LCGC14_1440430 [marine sediment metagenome]|uniref:Uncharacterized protein n=1 Tax=marine sediment metagenome TaxID=412755 RepID=A0A0F9K715_9ZZZZ